MPNPENSQHNISNQPQILPNNDTQQNNISFLERLTASPIDKSPVIKPNKRLDRNKGTHREDSTEFFQRSRTKSSSSNMTQNQSPRSRFNLSQLREELETIDLKTADISGDPKDVNVAYRPSNDKGEIHIARKEIKINNQIKIIIENLGHSGSGYTLGHGTVLHALEISKKDLEKNKEASIAVIGAGYIGLTTAILTKLSYPDCNITIYDNHLKEYENNETARNSQASHAAAAFLSVTKVSQDDLKTKQYLQDTYDFLKNIIDSKKKDPDYFSENDKFGIGECVEERELYYGQGCDEGMEYYRENNLVDHEIVNLDLGNVEISNMHYYKNAIYIDTHLLMKKLMEKALELGVKFKDKEITKYDDLDEEIINNCAGRGKFKEIKEDGRWSLNQTDSYEPVAIAGHSLYYLIDNPPNYILVDKIILKDKISGIENICRIQYFKKEIYNNKGELTSNVMIGGSFIRTIMGIELTDEENKKEHDIIKQAAQYYFGLRKEIPGFDVLDQKNIKRKSYVYSDMITSEKTVSKQNLPDH